MVLLEICLVKMYIGEIMQFCPELYIGKKGVTCAIFTLFDDHEGQLQVILATY